MAPAAGRPGAERLVVGLVRGVHGLRGEVRVEILSDDPARFEPGRVLHREASDAPLTIVRARDDRPPGLLVSFREVNDRSGAEALKGQYLEASAPAESLPHESYYWHEVVGSEVLTTSGDSLGRVEDIFRAGEAEVYVVRGGGREHLVPAVSAVIRELAPREGRIVVDEAALGVTEEDGEGRSS